MLGCTVPVNYATVVEGGRGKKSAAAVSGVADVIGRTTGHVEGADCQRSFRLRCRAASIQSEGTATLKEAVAQHKGTAVTAAAAEIERAAGNGHAGKTQRGGRIVVKRATGNGQGGRTHRARRVEVERATRNRQAGKIQSGGRVVVKRAARHGKIAQRSQCVVVERATGNRQPTGHRIRCGKSERRAGVDQRAIERPGREGFCSARDLQCCTAGNVVCAGMRSGQA